MIDLVKYYSIICNNCSTDFSYIFIKQLRQIILNERENITPAASFCLINKYLKLRTTKWRLI